MALQLITTSIILCLMYYDNMHKQIKLIILSLLLLLVLGQCYGQKDTIAEQCENWYIIPILYNRVSGDTTEIKYWENYWYYRTGDSIKLIPDTLKIKLDLVASGSILTEKTIPHAEYTIYSTLMLKYGDYEDSYLVVNPKFTEPILLYSEEIDLKVIYEMFINTNSMGYTFYAMDIPLKEIIEKYNIYIHDQIVDYSKGRLYFLNQIIISTYLLDKKGEKKCWYEFIFPVNGAYGNENGCCKWEF